VIEGVRKKIKNFAHRRCILICYLRVYKVVEVMKLLYEEIE